MKKTGLIVSMLLGLMLLCPTLISSAFAASPADFGIGRMVICETVEANEPFGVADVFAVQSGKVYCFLEARDIVRHTEVSFVWFHEDIERARVTLPLHQGIRWRTYASKKLAGQKGRWRVDALDVNGTVVHSVSFSVQ